jgi:hypothetical protein
MKYDENTDLLTFSTGKSVFANCGILGIRKDDDGGHIYIYEGYDGHLSDEDLTKIERIELADFVIGLWTEYKEVSA